jgi:hypothetical protein
MKRVAAVLVLVFLVSGGVSAQITMSGYAKTNFIPFKMTAAEGEDFKSESALQTPWGAVLSMGVTVSGDSEFAGFKASLDYEDDGLHFKAGSFNMIYLRPIETLKLSFGKFYDDKLMGKIGSPVFIKYELRHNSQNGGDHTPALTTVNIPDLEGNIFTRFVPYPNTTTEYGQNEPVNAAFMATYTPFAGFYSAAVVNPGRDFAKSTRDTFLNAQYGVGYDFPGLGLARIQYIGLSDWNVIEAALSVTALDFWIFDIGFKIPFEKKVKDNTFKHFDYPAAVGALFRYQDFELSSRVDVGFGGYIKDTTSAQGDEYSMNGFSILGILSPSYNFGPLILGADFAVEFFEGTFSKLTYGPKKNDLVSDGNKVLDFGGGIWIEKGFAPATIKAGITFQAPSMYQEVKQDLIIYIPIFITIGL